MEAILFVRINYLSDMCLNFFADNNNVLTVACLWAPVVAVSVTLFIHVSRIYD